jgi:hypothetical protein
MNSAINSFEYTEMFVAAPFELDYDEPNAVVEDQDVEFITTFEAIQAVELPVTSVIEVSETPAVQPLAPVAMIPVQHRTAA